MPEMSRPWACKVMGRPWACKVRPFQPCLLVPTYCAPCPPPPLPPVHTATLSAAHACSWVPWKEHVDALLDPQSIASMGPNAFMPFGLANLMGQVCVPFGRINLVVQGACPVEAGQFLWARCVPCGGGPTYMGQVHALWRLANLKGPGVCPVEASQPLRGRVCAFWADQACGPRCVPVRLELCVGLPRSVWLHCPKVYVPVRTCMYTCLCARLCVRARLHMHMHKHAMACSTAACWQRVAGGGAGLSRQVARDGAPATSVAQDGAPMLSTLRGSRAVASQHKIPSLSPQALLPVRHR